MIKKIIFIFCLYFISYYTLAESAREYFKIAKHSYDKQEYDKAIDFVNQAIIVDPDYINGYLLRAEINFRLEEYNQVIDDISFAFDLDENINKSMPEFHLLRGDAYIRLNKLNSAANDISFSLRLNPNNARAHYLMGLININRKIYFEALENLDKAIVLDSDESEYYYQRAKLKKLHFKPLPGTKIYESIMTDIKLSLALSPDDFRCYLLKCNMIKLDEHYDKAKFVAELDLYIEKFSEKSVFYAERGMIKVLMNRSQEAISDFTRAIHFDEENENNYLNRGLCFHNSKKYQLALNDYTKSINILVGKLKISNNDPATKKALSEAYNLRGMSNQLNGDKDFSCDDYYNSAKLGSKSGLNNYRKNCHVFN